MVQVTVAKLCHAYVAAQPGTNQLLATIIHQSEVFKSQTPFRGTECGTWVC
jgi:hypothetical protein